MPIDMIAVPGGVMPAALRYRPLVAALEGEARIHTKDLEVYAGDAPPLDYSIALEVAQLAAFADSLGLDRFHLLAYSGGGFVSLAFAGAYPERLRSLALFEPASIPGELTPEERRRFGEIEAGTAGQSGPAFMRAFVERQLRPGVPPPPPMEPAPPWMVKRPAGIAAMMAAFAPHPFDRNALRSVTVPVFYGYGELTSEQEEVRAGVVSRLFPDIHVRRFSGVHHFSPAEAIYGDAHLAALRDLWTRAAR